MKSRRPNTSTGTVRVCLTLPQEIDDAVSKIATAEGRTKSYQILVYIEDCLRRKKT